MSQYSLQRPLRVCHVITSFSDHGGAERALYRLVTDLDKKDCCSSIISLRTSERLGAKLNQMDIPVQALGMRKSWSSPAAIIKLRIAIQSFKPDLVQTWMYHANLLGGLITKSISRQLPVIWNLRLAKLCPQTHSLQTRLIGKAGAYLSSCVPKQIIVNSNRGYFEHSKIGYDVNRMKVIVNGFDTDKFSPNSMARSTIRKELGVSAPTLLVGRFGRYHPQKDYETFFKTAQLIKNEFPNIKYLLAGGYGITFENEELVSLVNKYQLCDDVILAGARDDMPSVYNACDLVVSSSAIEGFPNVIGESMASGVNCIVTDAGDSADIVGDPNSVVAVGDAMSLYSASARLLRLSATERQLLGHNARERIINNYSLAAVTEKYLETWRSVLRR